MSNSQKGDGLVTVIITVLNDKRIAKVVDELEKFTDRFELEIIIADGGSTDGTVELANKLATKYSNVHPIVSRGTVAFSRNAAIAASKGRYIAFIDADELPEVRWLDELYSALFADENIGFAGGPTPPLAYEKYSVAAKYYSSYLNWFYDNIASKRPEVIPMGNSIWKREVFENVGMLDASISSGEDHDFANRAMKAGWKGVYVKNAILYHDYSDMSLKKLWKKQSRYAMEGMVVYKRHRSTYQSSTINLSIYLLLPLLFVIAMVLLPFTRLISMYTLYFDLLLLVLLVIYLEIRGVRQYKKYRGLIYGWIEVVRKYAVLWGAFKALVHSYHRKIK